VQFLRQDNLPRLQFEAAWALTNIASGTSSDTHFVVDNGAVPFFVYLLKSPNDDVREQAVWALGNIAGDSCALRDMVLKNNALPPLIRQLQLECKLGMMRNATWLLSNLCRGKPAPDFPLVAPALETMARLIFSVDEEVLTDACWALSYLSDGLNDQIQAVIQAGVCTRLIELLNHPSPAVQTPALRTVGNIVTGDDLQTQVVINLGALNALADLLRSPRKGIRKEACWTISNITAGSPAQIEAVLKADIIPPLVQRLQSDEWDIQKEAAWAVSNATSGGTNAQVDQLVKQGCIPALVGLLGSKDPKVVTVAMEGLENILKVGEVIKEARGLESNGYHDAVEACMGIEALEYLWNHPETDIYYKSLRLLRKYFNGTDEADPQLETSVGADGVRALVGGAFVVFAASHPLVCVTLVVAAGQFRCGHGRGRLPLRLCHRRLN